MASTIKPSVHVIYCDDIRQEVGNKYSYMGVYSGVLYVPDFPVILPKLCLVVTATFPDDEEIKSLKLRLLQNDEQFFERDMDVGNVAEFGIAKATDVQRMRSFPIPVVFSPYTATEPMLLRVRIVKNGTDEMRGPGLHIAKAPAA